MSGHAHKAGQTHPEAAERRWNSPWAFPPGISESGVGLRETLAGLAAFVLLALMGVRAMRDAADGESALQAEASAGTAARAGITADKLAAKAVSFNRREGQGGGSIKDSGGGRE